MEELKELYPKDKLSYFNYIIDGLNIYTTLNVYSYKYAS